MILDKNAYVLNTDDRLGAVWFACSIYFTPLKPLYCKIYVHFYIWEIQDFRKLSNFAKANKSHQYFLRENAKLSTSTASVVYLQVMLWLFFSVPPEPTYHSAPCDVSAYLLISYRCLMAYTVYLQVDLPSKEWRKRKLSRIVLTHGNTWSQSQTSWNTFGSLRLTSFMSKPRLS